MIRADVKLQHVVDLSFGAFELPSYYRPYIQYCFDNQLILPEHCQSRCVCVCVAWCGVVC